MWLLKGGVSLKGLCSVLLGILLQSLVALPFEELEIVAALEAEACVGDGQTHSHELCLVGGLHREHLVGISRAVDVVVLHLYIKTQALDDSRGVGVQGALFSFYL